MEADFSEYQRESPIWQRNADNEEQICQERGRTHQPIIKHQHQGGLMRQHQERTLVIEMEH